MKKSFRAVLKPTMCEKMYYNRVISDDLKGLLLPGGGLRWLYSLVKKRDDLDFLIGGNKSKKWIYVYRGTTRLLDISMKSNSVKVSANPKYLNLAKSNKLDIFGIKKISDLNFKDDFISLISCLSQDSKLSKHYANKKEGYFQNLFSRQFGILTDGGEEFVVVDKEVVIGYGNKQIKENYFGEQRKRFMVINEVLSRLNAKRYGSKLNAKALGNELDFLAATKKGDILLIEFKHGSSTRGIYLSPIQIGLYYSLFQEYIKQYKENFISQINSMIEQKKGMGLISQRWSGVSFSGKIIPVLVIAEYNPDSSALEKLQEVLQICRDALKDNSFLSDLKIFEYNLDNQLKQLLY
jgi:hypothetical protein